MPKPLEDWVGQYEFVMLAISAVGVLVLLAKAYGIGVSKEGFGHFGHSNALRLVSSHSSPDRDGFAARTRRSGFYEPDLHPSYMAAADQARFNSTYGDDTDIVDSDATYGKPHVGQFGQAQADSAWDTSAAGWDKAPSKYDADNYASWSQEGFKRKLHRALKGH